MTEPVLPPLSPIYYAHSANAKGAWQPLKDHLQNVAARSFAEALKQPENMILSQKNQRDTPLSRLGDRIFT